LSVEEMIRSKTPKGETPICIFKVSQGDLLGKENVIWAGLGPFGSTENKSEADYE
jgi:hypothetical protein